MSKPKVLIIYTGGTIGMIRDDQKGTLKPFGLARLFKSIPSLHDLGIDIKAIELVEVIDSSNGLEKTMTSLMVLWCFMAQIPWRTVHQL